MKEVPYMAMITACKLENSPKKKKQKKTLIRQCKSSTVMGP